MELLARTRPKLRQVAVPAVLFALAAPATAGAAPAIATASKAKAPAPVITGISPKTVAISQTLTIHGRNFLRGRMRNTVVFKRDGAKAVFVRADVGTKKLLQVVVPDKLADVLVLREGAPVPTRFALRVLTKRFGKRFTKAVNSPIVTPEPPPPTEPPASAADGDCDGDKVLNGIDADDDNDLLSDDEEKRLKTDQCKADTDGDSVTDGYEYQSAIDLNDDEYRIPQNIVPAPYKKPYPNPLFADAKVDYDGDVLTLLEEFELWKAFRDPAKGLQDLVYSDGNQYSAYGRDGSGHRPGPVIGAVPPEKKYQDFSAWATANGYGSVEMRGIHWAPGTVVPFWDLNWDGAATLAGPAGSGPPGINYSYRVNEQTYWDFDSNAFLSDDERDEDADGLTNYDETHGRMQPGFWIGCYDQEGEYPVKYEGTSHVDPDTDGDGVLDGVDDVDHDDVINIQELSRNAANGRAVNGTCNEDANVTDMDRPQGWVNPFNPCLPDFRSRTCERHPSLGDAGYAPFGPDVPKFQVLN